MFQEQSLIIPMVTNWQIVLLNYSYFSSKSKEGPIYGHLDGHVGMSPAKVASLALHVQKIDFLIHLLSAIEYLFLVPEYSNCSLEYIFSHIKGSGKPDKKLQGVRDQKGFTLKGLRLL